MRLIGALTPSDQARFDRLVERSTPDRCWPWIGGTFRDGYGALRINGVSHAAHRLAYAYYVGYVPDHLCVCHHCDNRACCNPAHLFLGTQGDNGRDRDRKGRTKLPPGWTRRGEGNSSNKLKPFEVLDIRSRHGSASTWALARQYGVAQSTIRRILNRKKWAWL